MIGGILTLTSMALPWRTLNGIPRSVFEVWSFGFGLALIIPFLILFGACFSVVSRYGGAVTVAGFITYIAYLPAEFGLGSNATPPPSSFGVGFWIVWVGAMLSAMGKSWNLPFLQKLLPGLLKPHRSGEPTETEAPDSTNYRNNSDPSLLTVRETNIVTASERQATLYPAFAGYQRQTKRTIPVVAFTKKLQAR